MRWIRFALALMVLAGCATASFPPLLLDPPDGHARIVAYRIGHDVSAAWAHHFWIDDKAAADLIAGSYSHLLVRPGPHRARLGDAGGTHRPAIAFDAQAGKTYYFRYGALPTPEATAARVNPDAHAGALSLVTETFARRELENYRFRPPATPSLE